MSSRINDRLAKQVAGSSVEPDSIDSLAELPAAMGSNPQWEDTAHRPGDPPLRQVPKDLGPNTPDGRAARTLGAQIRAWRETQRLTQRELATRLGWEQPTVARLEAGVVAPTLTTLALLVDRLGVRIAVAPGRDGPLVTIDQAPASDA